VHCLNTKHLTGLERERAIKNHFNLP
jgi:hypothetical protein